MKWVNEIGLKKITSHGQIEEDNALIRNGSLKKPTVSLTNFLMMLKKYSFFITN